MIPSHDLNARVYACVDPSSTDFCIPSSELSDLSELLNLGLRNESNSIATGAAKVVECHASEDSKINLVRCAELVELQTVLCKIDISVGDRRYQSCLRYFCEAQSILDRLEKRCEKEEKLQLVLAKSNHRISSKRRKCCLNLRNSSRQIFTRDPR